MKETPTQGGLCEMIDSKKGGFSMTEYCGVNHSRTSPAQSVEKRTITAKGVGEKLLGISKSIIFHVLRRDLLQGGEGTEK